MLYEVITKLENLPEGIYLVNCLCDQQLYSNKFVFKRKLNSI